MFDAAVDAILTRVEGEWWRHWSTNAVVGFRAYEQTKVEIWFKCDDKVDQFNGKRQNTNLNDALELRTNQFKSYNRFPGDLDEAERRPLGMSQRKSRRVPLTGVCRITTQTLKESRYCYLYSYGVLAAVKLDVNFVHDVIL